MTEKEWGDKFRGGNMGLVRGSLCRFIKRLWSLQSGPPNLLLACVRCRAIWPATYNTRNLHFCIL